MPLGDPPSAAYPPSHPNPTPPLQALRRMWSWPPPPQPHPSPPGAAQDVELVLAKGLHNRSTFATNMNEHSSRSHLIMSLFVQARDAKTGAQPPPATRLPDSLSA